MEEELINDFIMDTKKIEPKINKDPVLFLIKLLRNLEKSELKKFSKSISEIPEKDRNKKQVLCLSVINYILSQDNEKLIILQAKEFASRLEKNNEITIQQLFIDIPNCDKTFILDFFNKISKMNIEMVRDEIDKFINDTYCKFDEDIKKIFHYISNQNDEDLNIIIHSFILRSNVVVKNRPSLKQYYEKYLSEPTKFTKEKMSTQLYLTSSSKEKEKLLKDLKKTETAVDQTVLYEKVVKNIIISKMLKKYEFHEGDEVEAHFKELWLPCTITSVNSDNTFDILYVVIFFFILN